MGTMGEEIGPEFVLLPEMSIIRRSTQRERPALDDQLELIYSHPELMIDWYPYWETTNTGATHKLYWTTAE